MMKKIKIFNCFVLGVLILVLSSQIVVASESIQITQDITFTQEEIERLNEAIEESMRERTATPISKIMEDKSLYNRLYSLFVEANQGNFNAVVQFIEAGGSANMFPPDGNLKQFIFYAVGKNNIEMVKYLVGKGAKVNSLCHAEGNTFLSPLSIALRMAMFTESFEIIDYLRSEGAKFPKEILESRK